MAWGGVWRSRRIRRWIKKRCLIAGWHRPPRLASKARLRSSNPHLYTGTVGATIGHFTMRCTAPVRAPVLMVVVALLFATALAAAPQIDSVYGPVPGFELHSGFWINLHHRLYEEARQHRAAASAGGVKSERSAKPILQVAPAAKPALTASEQRAWDDAVSYYVANYADNDLLFSTELVLLKNQLG